MDKLEIFFEKCRKKLFFSLENSEFVNMKYYDGSLIYKLIFFCF